MPRNGRCVVTGTPYHITQRGTNRQVIFHSAADRRTYPVLVRENLEDVVAGIEARFGRKWQRWGFEKTGGGSAAE